MSDSDKEALLNGTAAIETKLEFHNDNLFDSLQGSSGYVNNQGTITALDTNYSSDYIKINTNVTYTISVNTTINNIGLAIFDNEKQLLNRSNNRNISSLTFTAANDGYVRFWVEIDGETVLDSANVSKVYNVRLEEGEPIILTEENSVISWNHEDFRYVKDQGWIGQFVARQVTGKLKNISDDFNITDREFELKLGVKVEDNTTWYSLGNFLISKITDDEVNDITSFEALDYTKKFNKVYEDTITYPCTALELAQNVCAQCGVELATTDFINNNYSIEGNPFTNNETCRDVMKAIGQLAFSWVRVGWDNCVYIDFDETEETSSYDTITNHEYYNLKTQKESFGPVNRIVIGYSQIEGERTKIEDEASIDANGVCELTIYDNPLVYTQEQRESIIGNASFLYGLNYMPLNMLTIGHPWLKGNETIQVVDMEDNSYSTIPFDRTIQYFGHIKTLIDSSAPTRTNTEYAYPSDIKSSIKKVEIEVDKINGTITEEILGEDPDSLQSQVSKSVRDIESLTNIFQITGGTNLIKNSQFMFTDEVWEFVDGTDAYHTPLGSSYDSSLIGITVSNSKIQLKNIKINTTLDNIDNLIKGQTYTLNYYYKQDELTTTTVRLISNLNESVVFERTYNDEVTDITSDEFQFVADNNSYTFEVETYTTSGTDGYFYLYDLMLNSGDKKAWEPAANEIYSTVLKMSQLGLQVVATGSNIITLLTSQGFQVRKFENDTIGIIITEFTDTGLVTGIAQTTETHIGNYVMKTLNINNTQHHVEYFGGE